MINEEQLPKKSVDFNLIQIPEVITDKEARELIQFHKTHPHLLSEDTAPYYHKKKIPIGSIRTQWIRDLMRRIEYLCIAEIGKYGLNTFPEQTEIMKMDVGTEIPTHIDVYDDFNGKEVIPKSAWAGVLYLNENYKGGKLRFEPAEMLPMGFEYTPCAREMVLFQGMEFHHSVSKVYRNTRYTMPMWFTTDFKDIRPEYPN